MTDLSQAVALRRARSGLQRARLACMSESRRAAITEALATLPETADLDLRHGLALVQKRTGLPVTGHPDRATLRAVNRRSLEVAAETAAREAAAAALSEQVVHQRSEPEVAALVRQVRGLLRIVGADAPLPPPPPNGRRVITWISCAGTLHDGWARVAFDGTGEYVLGRLADMGLEGYEPETVATVLAALELNDGGFHDVGANIGVFALVVKSLVPDVQVTAFEPGAALAGTCRTIAELNCLHVVVEQVALADDDGSAEFFMSPTDTSNSLRAGFRRAVASETVEVARLDTWLAGNPGREPAVLKIDTESTEPDVLAGGSDFLARARPWLVVEVLKGRTETRLEEWCDEMRYHRHHITAHGPVAREEIIGDETYEHLNWLLTPMALPDDFARAFDRWHQSLTGSVTVEVPPKS